MIRYLIRRILFLVLVLWIVSGFPFLIFVKLPPGDPARRAAGRTSTPQTIHAARIALGLDKPVWVQYLRFAKGLIPWPGFFLNKQVYYSWSDFVPISENIYSKLPVDITLTIGAAVVWLIMGIPMGMSVLRAAFHGSFVLPWVVLSLAFAAFYARMTRANLIETMSEDYIR